MTDTNSRIGAAPGSSPSQPASVETAIRRFSCTQCGRCCNRSPEVALSEAAALADVFVFWLMFRTYALPSRLSDYAVPGERAADAGAIFYGKKRLLGAFAAHKRTVRQWRDGKAVPYDNYLMISALAIDRGSGACAALVGTRCGIYDRRPVGCRTVPFHYSRAEALAEAGLKTFVETPGYRCDTSATAQVALADGRIVAPGIVAARSQALAQARRDRPWSEAIVRRMKARPPADPGLPTLEQVESDARFGATTTPMLVAWRIAADLGLISRGECTALAETQLAAITRELAAGRCTPDARQALAGLHADYRQYLERPLAIAH